MRSFRDVGVYKHWSQRAGPIGCPVRVRKACWRLARGAEGTRLCFEMTFVQGVKGPWKAMGRTSDNVQLAGWATRIGDFVVGSMCSLRTSVLAFSLHISSPSTRASQAASITAGVEGVTQTSPFAIISCREPTPIGSEAAFSANCRWRFGASKAGCGVLLFWQLESATVRESAEVQDSLQSRWRLSSKQARASGDFESALFIVRAPRFQGPSAEVRRTSTGTPCTPLRARAPRWTHEWTLRRATAMRLCGPAAHPPF